MLCFFFAEIDDACTSDSDCSNVANAECTGNVCTCDAGHTASADKTTCEDNGKCLLPLPLSGHIQQMMNCYCFLIIPQNSL